MADEQDVRNETEAVKVDDNKTAVLSERNSEESEEEALVYDHSNGETEGETSEESGISVYTCSDSVNRSTVVDNEQNDDDDEVAKEPATDEVEHVQEQKEEKGTEDTTEEGEIKEKSPRESYSEQEQDGEEEGDDDEEEEEDKDEQEELEWKEEEKVVNKVVL